VNCVTLLSCNVRHYALYLVGHPKPTELVSLPAVGTRLPFCIDVPLNTCQSFVNRQSFVSGIEVNYCYSCFPNDF